MWFVLVAVLASACGGRAAIDSCDGDLGGRYANGAERWMILDHGASLEAFPLFDDTPEQRELEIGPRVIDLARKSGAVTGSVRRRYMRGAQVCVARATARITACAGDGLDIVLTDPASPLEWEPCTWPRLDSSRRERWIRE